MVKKERHSPEVRRMAQLIRRNMIQKDHGSKKVYTRKNTSWKSEE